MNLKIKIFIITFFSFFLLKNVSSKELILPKSKPSIDQTSKELVLDNYIIPQKKPSEKLEVDSDIVEEPTKSSKYLLPKKKPLIFKKTKDKIAVKSKYYSKSDLEITRRSIAYMEKSQWVKSLKTAKKARDKSIYKFINVINVIYSLCVK